jgi:diketogulonate reductase-like aldo/keto reductase
MWLRTLVKSCAKANVTSVLELDPDGPAWTPQPAHVIAKEHDCSPARISLAWLLAKPIVTSVIIGAKWMDQLQDNLAAVDLELTVDEIKLLDEVSALPPEYLGWALAQQGADR